MSPGEHAFNRRVNGSREDRTGHQSKDQGVGVKVRYIRYTHYIAVQQGVWYDWYRTGLGQEIIIMPAAHHHDDGDMSWFVFAGARGWGECDRRREAEKKRWR